MRGWTLGLLLVLTSASAFAEAAPASLSEQSEAWLKQIEAERLEQQEARRQAAEVARQAARDTQRRAAAEAREAAQEQQARKVADTSGIPPAPGYVAPQAAPQDFAEIAKLRWGAQVRAHTAQLIAGAASKRGRISVSFKVSETGDVFNVEVTGEPHDAKLAAAILRTAHMPAPPDQRDHTITVGVNVQDGQGPIKSSSPMTVERRAPGVSTYDADEGKHWMNQVHSMLQAKMAQFSHSTSIRPTGKVAICFHVGPDGRVLLQEFCAKSGHADVDALAMRALHAAAPFPPPPTGFDRGVIWVTSSEGTPPVTSNR